MLMLAACCFSSQGTQVLIPQGVYRLQDVLRAKEEEAAAKRAPKETAASIEREISKLRGRPLAHVQKKVLARLQQKKKDRKSRKHQQRKRGRFC